MVVKLFSSVYTLMVYTMKIHLLIHLVKDIMGFQGTSDLDVLVYEQFSVSIEKAYGWLYRKQKICTQETDKLMEQQGRDEQHVLSTTERSGLLRVLKITSFQCKEDACIKANNLSCMSE